MAEYERPASNYFKFGKIGDFIRGTLVNRYQQDNKLGAPGAKQWVYELRAEEGFFHNIVEKVPQAEQSDLAVGETYLVSGKAIIDRNMRTCQIGQGCIMRYTGDFKLPNGNTAKTVEVLLEKGFKPSADASGDDVGF